MKVKRCLKSTIPHSEKIPNLTNKKKRHQHVEVLHLFRCFTHTHKLLHTKAFTHKSLYTQKFLYRDALHTEAFTHRSFYTRKLLQTKAFYIQTLLHTNAFTHKRFYTQKLLHTEPFTHRCFYTQKLLHTDALFLHTGPLTGPTKFAKNTQFFTLKPRFVRKGCRGHFKIAILPKFWTIEPPFVRKGCRRTNQSRKKILSFWRSNLISCEMVAISWRLIGTARGLKREEKK